MARIYSVRVQVFAVFVVFLAGCSMDHSEISRLVSPDGQVTAVLAQDLGGGAAGASGYYLYLMEANSSGELKHPNFMATGCPGLSAAWVGRGTLQLNYPAECSIKQFTNLWYSQSDIQNARHASVEVVLVRVPDK